MLVLGYLYRWDCASPDAADTVGFQPVFGVIGRGYSTGCSGRVSFGASAARAVQSQQRLDERCSILNQRDTYIINLLAEY